MICPICGLDVPITSHAEQLGLRPEQVLPAIASTALAQFVAPHFYTSWAPGLRVQCPMSSMKVRPL